MHREIFYCDKTKEGYEELYNSLKEEKSNLSLDWITWQIEDERFFTKEQAFDFLYYFINRYSEENEKLKFKFGE